MMRNRLIWVIDGSFKSILTTSSWTIAGRKTKLLTNAGTTAREEPGAGAAGAGSLARVLGQCLWLDTLNLESNGIGAEGAGMYMGSWRGCYCMRLITFQAGFQAKSHHIASGGERGGRAGAVLFIRRAIPQRQMGVNNIRERGFAMLRTSIRDGKPSQDHPRKINTRSLSLRCQKKQKGGEPHKPASPDRV